MSSTSRSRRFINHPAGSKLFVVVTVDPPGSVAVKMKFSVDGVATPPSPPESGVMTFRCPKANTSYRLNLDMGWLATGRVVIACWLEQPDGTEVHRDSMVFSAKKGVVDSAQILVVTS
jgi:hypothetical protein